MPPRIHPRFERFKEIQRLRQNLERDGFPRLQMFLLVSITSGAGFLASFLLLRFGLDTMWLRYLAALGGAYAVFLFLLWLWLRTRTEDYSDFPDISNLPSGRSGSSPEYSGKGGDFGGGGASGRFDGAHESASSSSDFDAPVGEALDVVSGADEFALPLAALALFAALVLSSFWVVYIAPALFAELLVDGVLAASLYRRLRGLETRHWLETALRRTFWPFVLTALMVAGCGWAMQLYSPEAHTIGQVISHWKNAL
ncbi:MAG: hypothetical protein Q8O38_08525 [Sulfurimicrobium sp.]|nr:hypothetical protein [Sulfurimicrobium sp.]